MPMPRMSANGTWSAQSSSQHLAAISLLLSVKLASVAAEGRQDRASRLMRKHALIRHQELPRWREAQLPLRKPYAEQYMATVQSLHT